MCHHLLVCLVVFSVLFRLNLGVKCRNNVCQNLKDYETISTNRNCYYNPDVELSIESIANRYGYSIESHTFTSKDGYILTWHRLIDSNLNNPAKMKKKQPILLHHGISLSSIAWVMAGRQSFAFYLVDTGFDVWMSNVRGNPYSFQHRSHTINSTAYWNFGLDEMAIYDLPAGIDLIAQKTGDKGNLILIGHSMGTTISFIYASIEGKHAEKNLKKIIALAPVAYLKNMKVAEKFKLEALAEPNSLLSFVTKSFCIKYPLISSCTIALLSSSGFYLKQLRADLFPIYFANFPTALSAKLLKHFSQIINSNGRFPMYDYGVEKNLKIYNATVPPDYDLNQIAVPVYLLTGTRDFISSPIDVEVLKNQLDSNNLSSSKQPTQFITLPLSHFDFLFAKQPQILYDVLLKIIGGS